jgi:hypothetical protein
MKTFTQRYQESPEWQQKACDKVLAQLEGIDLSDSEKVTLLWLCGTEQHSVNNILAIINKAMQK